jgi:hypothetical protein
MAQLQLFPSARTAFKEAGPIAVSEDPFDFLLRRYRDKGVIVEAGALIFPLRDAGLSYGNDLIKAVEKDSTLAEKIFFRENGLQRHFDTVVWNLEKDALKFARRIYREQKSGARKTYLVVTPPLRNVMDPNSRELMCAPLDLENDDGKIRFITMLKTECTWNKNMRDCRDPLLIQSNRISVCYNDKDRQVILLIPTQSGFHRAVSKGTAYAHVPHPV